MSFLLLLCLLDLSFFSDLFLEDFCFLDFLLFFRSLLERERDRDLLWERSEDSSELGERLRFFFDIVSESIF